MVTFWANKKRDTFQESETSMNPLITWRDKAVTQSMILSSEESEVTFVTEDIILCIGWVSVWTELKSLSIQQLQSTVSLSHYGPYRVEMLLLPITISQWTLTELEHKFIHMYLQVETKKAPKENSDTFMVAHMLLPPMDQELRVFQEPMMVYWLHKSTWTCADKSRTFGDSQWQDVTKYTLNFLQNTRHSTFNLKSSRKTAKNYDLRSWINSYNY